jgi:hypothetical protein
MTMAPPWWAPSSTPASAGGEIRPTISLKNMNLSEPKIIDIAEAKGKFDDFLMIMDDQLKTLQEEAKIKIYF